MDEKVSGNGGKGVISSAVNLISGQMEAKMMEDQARVDELVANVAEIDAKEAKVEVKPKKNRRKIMKTESKTEQKEVKKVKGGDIVNNREVAERLLAKVCKELNIRVQRIQPKRDIQIGNGALQAIRGDGLKAAVRSHDVCLYSPYDVIKIGRPERGGYPHVTIVRHDDPRVEEAIRKCLKDKKSNTAWASELKASRRTRDLESISDRKKRLEAELKAIKAMETSLKKKKARVEKLVPTSA